MGMELRLKKTANGKMLIVSVGHMTKWCALHMVSIVLARVVGKFMSKMAW